MWLAPWILACAGPPRDTGGPEPVPTEEMACEDGADDDLDGLVDCDDGDCAYAAAVEGACVNRKDLRKYADFDANAEWNRCVPGPPLGQGCGVDEDCNTACVHDNTGISTGCSRCFAELVTCFIGSCAAECAQQPPTEACNTCVADACLPAYTACFGTLACPYETGCRDTVDNDGDGLVDSEDPDCAG